MFVTRSPGNADRATHNHPIHLPRTAVSVASVAAASPTTAPTAAEFGCPAGFYGSGGDDCAACPDGTFSTASGGTSSASDCVKSLKVS